MADKNFNFKRTESEKFKALEDFVSEVSKVNVRNIREHNRRPLAVEARMVVWTIAHLYLKYSFPKIAEIYRRDHSTIIHGVKKMTGSKEFMDFLEDAKGKYPHLFEEDEEAPKGISSWKI